MHLLCCRTRAHSTDRNLLAVAASPFLFSGTDPFTLLLPHLSRHLLMPSPFLAKLLLSRFNPQQFRRRTRKKAHPGLLPRTLRDSWTKHLTNVDFGTSC